MLTQQDRDIAHGGDIPSNAANEVGLAVEVRLAVCVELGVVEHVVVALRQQIVRLDVGLDAVAEQAFGRLDVM